MTILFKRDGTQDILRADSENILRKMRSKQCRALGDKIVFPSPLIKDGRQWNLQMPFYLAKKRGGV